ncbi:hypothetical protein [Lactobacillus pasteurii]|nr:hypothetical protein [Lactobacillus pasteurii]
MVKRCGRNDGPQKRKQEPSAKQDRAKMLERIPTIDGSTRS